MSVVYNIHTLKYRNNVVHTSLFLSLLSCLGVMTNIVFIDFPSYVSTVVVRHTVSKQNTK